MNKIISVDEDVNELCGLQQTTKKNKNKKQWR